MTIGQLIGCTFAVTGRPSAVSSADTSGSQGLTHHDAAPAAMLAAAGMTAEGTLAFTLDNPRRRGLAAQQSGAASLRGRDARRRPRRERSGVRSPPWRQQDRLSGCRRRRGRHPPLRIARHGDDRHAQILDRARRPVRRDHRGEALAIMADLHFELVTPEKLLRSEEVQMVVVPGTEGDFGVMAGHAPYMATLRATASSPSTAPSRASPSGSPSKAASPRSARRASPCSRRRPKPNRASRHVAGPSASATAAARRR